MHHRRAEETIERRLLDLAYDAIFAIEAGSHRITYWSGGAQRLYGFTSEEALGRPSSDLLKTRWPPGSAPGYEAAAATGAWEGLLVQTRKDGMEIIVEGRWALDRETGNILEINRDVTARVRVQERFQLLVESVQDYAIFLLDPDGRIASWNEGARRIKGYDDNEIIGRHFSAFYPIEDLVAGKPDRELQAAIEQGRHEDEGWRVRKDGSHFWANVVITALRDPSGALTGFAKVTRDVTARRQEQDRLEDLERSKSNFLNLAAHELRGPLTVIRGYLSLLREGDVADRQIIEGRVLPALDAKTEEMSQLVEQMVEAARLEEGSLRLRRDTVDLGTVAERAVEVARALADPLHPVVLEPFPEELNVVGDSDRIRIIVGNLLTNAIKYSPQGGAVTVRVDRTDGFGTVTVTDQGIGIPDASRDKLFVLFGRLERSETAHIAGTGLGLYLSRELARMHGGDLLLEASGPEGSRFTLRLPLARR